MNTLKIKRTLIISAIISFTLSLVIFFILKAESSLYIMYYTFDLVGLSLRKLSLSSNLGNIIALLIYLSICLIPMGIYFYKHKKEKNKSINYILIGISAYLFYAIYQFINSKELYSLLPDELYGSEDFITIGKLSVAMMFYIILVTYFVLISLNSLSIVEKTNKKNTLKSLQIILTLFLLSDIVIIFYFGIFDVLGKINSHTALFYIAKYILSVFSIIMSMIVIFIGINLINDFNENQYGKNVVKNMNNIYEYSKKTVYASVLSSLLINGMQLLFSSSVGDINMFLNIPFAPLIVAFLGIILCKYFKEDNDLSDDNNSII